MSAERSYRFSHCLARLPGQSVVDGLRDGASAGPDPAAFKSQHEVYVSALESAGAAVTVPTLTKPRNIETSATRDPARPTLEVVSTATSDVGPVVSHSRINSGSR